MNMTDTVDSVETQVVIHFKNGKAQDIQINANPLPISEIEW